MAVNKVNFGNETLIDLTSDTVVPEALLTGYTAHKADGTIIQGSLRKMTHQEIVAAVAAAFDDEQGV